jgi:hypothetical protein
MGSWMTLGCRWAHVQRLHILTCLQVMELILIMLVLIQCAMCTSFPGTRRAFTAHIQIQSQLKITHADKDLQATCCWFQQKLLPLNYLSAYVQLNATKLNRRPFYIEFGTLFKCRQKIGWWQCSTKKKKKVSDE